MEIRDYTEYNEAEIARLYGAVGWTAYTSDLPALREGFANSLLTLAAYDGDRLLGVLRAVGDGKTIVYIQDLLVYPSEQRRGVGTALLREALRRYSSVRQIALTTDRTPQTLAFYRSLGFADYDSLGCCGFLYLK